MIDAKALGVRAGEQWLFDDLDFSVRMWNGRIYICDVRGKGVTVLDLRKKQTRVMGASGTTTKLFRHNQYEGQSLLPHLSGSTTSYAIGTFAP